MQMFSGRTSLKVQHLNKDPSTSVVVTNHAGECEGCVAFAGKIVVRDFSSKDWHAIPEAFVSLEFVPDDIRMVA